jgi:hypothetical protein
MLARLQLRRFATSLTVIITILLVEESLQQFLKPNAALKPELWIVV